MEPLPSALHDRVVRCRDRLWDELLAEQIDGTWWAGELSSSALSTATAVAALALIDRDGHRDRIDRGLQWLRANINADGGFGDTIRSKSNISTTFLVRAAVAITEETERYTDLFTACGDWIEEAGGTPAILAKYGKDRTFSVPILMMGALGGLCTWKQIPRLPFELAALPRQFYAAVRLPVVSYAMPALIAIGQLLHEKNPSPWPTRFARNAARRATLAKLIDLQPSNGGFLEATPLTSFVTMSLAAMNLRDHPVATKGTAFLVDSQRPDGSWPIDTHLATWVTTLTINAWGPEARDRLPSADATRDWLLDQQYHDVHPFTGAAPGGWAWTPLPGGVPDADDTAGAIRALCHLGEPGDRRVRHAIAEGHRWLAGLQNRDGGIPTFCRGWGTLPFDQSTAELTAHAIQACRATEVFDSSRGELTGFADVSRVDDENRDAVADSMRRFLGRSQSEGLYQPLWFGNEHHPDEANPVYGTSRVVDALAEVSRFGSRERAPLEAQQNDDGGFGGSRGLPSTVEETAVAISAMTASGSDPDRLSDAAGWLCGAIESNRHHTATSIGLYFANLWYYEKLYPHTFALAALNKIIRRNG